MRAAKDLERNSVGIELNPDFLPLIKEKIQFNQNNLFDKGKFEIIKDVKNI